MKIPSRFFALLQLLVVSEIVLSENLDQAPSFLLGLATEKHIEEFRATTEAKGFRTEYNIGKIDPRLSEKTCQQEWSLEFSRDPKENEHTSILASCNDSFKQKYYLNLKIKLWGSAVVSKRLIPQNATIGHEDLSVTELQVNKSGTRHFQHTAPIIGMTAKRTIKEGRIISPTLLKAPRLVSRGDDVVILATNNRISIKMRGEALNHGRLGQQITVKNKQSERLIRARVTDFGVVQVAL